MNFVLRSVQQNLCPELPEWKFKKQCSKKNSTINAYFGSQLTSATKEQMVELKAKCSAICGDRTVTLNLAPLSATMEFLSSNGKERHAMCIEANLSAALESTTNVTNSGTQDNAILNSWRSRWIRGNIHMINWSSSSVQVFYVCSSSIMFRM